ncbi:hypothetical protein [Kitasatospora aureofaciens]|uniref:hypothetical protein n=1 Tax=Kitasatospora aureofaciens TaxID=1894 RepID=UPI00210E7F48|nr:hypothetical protein [Kitasatospora aureofaciens]
MTFQPYATSAEAPPSSPSPYATSEATRLLCAGVYLDPEFRRRVISELVEHDERSVPPSLGFDLVQVLAHALKARAAEALTGAVLAVLWLGFFAASYQPLIAHPPTAHHSSGYGYGGGYGSSPSQAFGDGVGTAAPYVANFAFLYALVCLLSWFAKTPAARDHALYAPAPPAGSPSPLRRARSGFLAVVAVLAQLGYWALAVNALRDSYYLGAVFPFALAAVVWVHRLLAARTVRERLNRLRYPDLPPVELPRRGRYRALAAAIEAEQYSPLVVYDSAQPFLGAGVPFQPWSFVLELKRRTTGRVLPEQRVPPEQPDLTARAVLDLIVPRLLALRQAAAETSLDRLRDMEVREVVFLPHGPQRAAVRRDREAVEQHLRDAVDEGAERRRHFLRIRVGAWDEQVVLSVLIRVHTQGRLLVLEVVPHVLGPVRHDYELLADAVALRGVRLRSGRPAVSAFVAGPAALQALLRYGAGPGGGLGAGADGGTALSARPTVSLRELAAESTVSLLQDLDVNRYVRTIQERVIAGVREALHSEGYETGRFEQTVVQVLEGGVYIGAMSGGAVASGAGASARAGAAGGEGTT